MIGVYFLAIFIGASLGSFAHSLAKKAFKKGSIWSRSHCPHCKKKLQVLDLIPILSFLFLRGKCRYCGDKIPIDHLLSETVMAVLAAMVIAQAFTAPSVFLNFNLGTLLIAYELLFKLFLLTILAAIFLTDLKTGLIPDKITYPAILVVSFYLVSAAAFKSLIFYLNLKANPLGVYLMPPHSSYLLDNLLRVWQGVGLTALVALSLALFFILLILITGGKGMGWGDVKYILFLGLALSFPFNILATFLAFLIGAIFSILLILLGKKRLGQSVPFGPFLSIGATLSLLFGTAILNWYMALLGLA